MGNGAMADALAVWESCVEPMPPQIPKGNHAAHAFVDVVAVEPDKQNNDRGNCRPEHLERQIAFQGDAITELARTSPETHQTEHNQPNDSDEENRANAEQNTK